MPHRTWIVQGFNPLDDDMANGSFNPKSLNESDYDGPWFHVSNQNPRPEPELTEEEEREAAEKLQAREEEQELINGDEMLRYRYDTDLEQKAYTRRLIKDFSKLKRLGLTPDWRSVHRYVTGNWNHSREPVIMQKNQSEEDGSSNRRLTYRQTLKKVRSKADAAKEAQIEKQAEEGDLSIQTFTREFIEQVINARLAAGLSQAQMAHKLYRTENLIKDFEKGELNYDARLKSLFKMILNLSS